MKYSRTEPEKENAAASKADKNTIMETEIVFNKEISDLTSPIDALQTSVYCAGKRTLKVIKEKKSVENAREIEDTEKLFKELGKFSYNVGFAGEQSCGKSTVINSLLQYPLMPTCKLKTTASMINIAYSEHFRVRAIDDDSQKVIFDFDCEIPREKKSRHKFIEQFQRMLDYGVSAMEVLIIENFQYFSKVDIKNQKIGISDLDMKSEDPRQVMFLLFVLLGVYVGQNDLEWTDKVARLMNKREVLFKYLGIPKDVVNISVFAQANFEILKSGLKITDLPGLGSNASNQERNGKKVKGHDDITKEAIQTTDSMVFIITPENRKEGYQVMPEMLSNARLKEVVFKGDRIIPVINKTDGMGKMEIATCDQDFLKALHDNGVEKNDNDIIHYAGIYGEYNFDDIPFERTLYYAQNYDDNNVRIDAEVDEISYEEEKAKKIKKLQLSMKHKYENAGIEELKKFFRTSYVDKGKYAKSIAAVQAIRTMIMSAASFLETIAVGCATVTSVQSELHDKMDKNLDAAIKKPINQITEQYNVVLERIGDDVNAYMEEQLDDVSQWYINAFNESLSDYKTKLNDILSGFELTWLGLGSKARIDVPGSFNRERYLKLTEAISELPVSLTTVNQQYEKVLRFTGTKIDRFYKDTLEGLEHLKKDIRESLNDSIMHAEKKGLSAEDIQILNALKEQLVVFVDKQIEVTSQDLKNQQDAETDAKHEVLGEIMDLNNMMTKQYAESISQQLTDKLSIGGFFESKEFLLIDGDSGMKSAINALNLGSEEKDNIKANIDAEVNTRLKIKLSNWIDDLYHILAMYGELVQQLEKPVSDMLASMSNSAEENRSKLETIEKQLIEWCKIGEDFRMAVQDSVKDAFDYMNDREPSNLLLQGNVLYGCFSKEVEQKYERIREAEQKDAS